ncbi:hypothetical protein J6T66_00175 [bacterium]|nr:hypothetical protein [bacterium]
MITQIHFTKTIRPGASAKANAYIVRHINQNIISHNSAIPILVLARNCSGLTGKLK